MLRDFSGYAGSHNLKEAGDLLPNVRICPVDIFYFDPANPGEFVLIVGRHAVALVCEVGGGIFIYDPDVGYSAQIDSLWIVSIFRAYNSSLRLFQFSKSIAPPTVNIDLSRLVAGMGDRDTELSSAVSVIQDIDTDISSETSEGAQAKESVEIASVANFDFATRLRKDYERGDSASAVKKRDARYAHFASARAHPYLSNTFYVTTSRQICAAVPLNNSE